MNNILWRNTLSLGCVLIAAAWFGAFGLIGLGALLGYVYLSHLGIALAALGGTLTLVREHCRTRRHMYAVGMATRDPEAVPVPRSAANLTRLQRD